MSVTTKSFGKLTSGEEITLYHIENAAGAYAEVMDYGAILVNLVVPDRNGTFTDVVLGFDDVQKYEVNKCFFGATIGPNGNRIGGAAFDIDGQHYTLAQNENENNLHSGPNGFEKKIWQAAVDEQNNAVTFTLQVPDGLNGFPGNRTFSVTYAFDDDCALSLTYYGVSDKATVANLTNHSYFNLNGEGSGDILDTVLQIHAAAFSAIPDSKAIPTGEARPVTGTVMDFTAPKKIGLQIDEQDEQLLFTGGYDHNFVLDDYNKGTVRPIACACSEKSGIRMTVSSDQPCVQFYAGNGIGSQAGKKGHVYTRRNGFCLETQVEPNAVNTPSFHSPVIAAGEEYRTQTVYSFDRI
ncbi:MAG: galactose mutarotase [Blautia sp.]|nr:galactose mutarotase [Blautia sp.]